MIRLCESAPPTEWSKFSTVNGAASARSATQETFIRQTIYFSALLNYRADGRVPPEAPHQLAFFRDGRLAGLLQPLPGWPSPS